MNIVAALQALLITPRAERVSVGGIVHYVLPENGEHQPAIIVNNWGNEEACEGGCACNLCVLADGANDATYETQHGEDGELKRGPLVSHWTAATSVCYSEMKGPNTWHWPEGE